MRSDAQLAFVPIGNPLSLVAALGVVIPSPGIIDILGQGVGQAPGNIIGNQTLFGADIGVGGIRPELAVNVGAAVAAGAGGALNAALQAAPDTGIGGGYQPGAWQTIEETGPIPFASLIAGAPIMRLPFPPVTPGSLRPRYYRLAFNSVIAAITAGTIANALVTIVRDDQANKQAAKNFTVM